MIARTRAVGALLLSFSILSTSALAQEPDFGELHSTETHSVTRVDRHRVLPLDTRQLDADMEEVRGLLDEAFQTWARIVDKSERTYKENNGLRNIIFHFWDDERFDAARAEAAKLQETMSKAQGRVQRINSFFVSTAAHQPEMYTQLLERHANVLELVTQFNTLVDWGTIRSLDFDTAAWGNEREVWILNPADYKLAAIPPHPRIELREQGAVQTRTHSSTGDGIVENSTTLVTSRTVFLQALDPAKVRPWVAGALEAANAATAARTVIVGKAIEASKSTADFSKKRLLVQNQADFDVMKREAAKFAEAMARLKGKRNGAFSLLTGSDLLKADPNLAADWEEVLRRYDELAGWGDAHYIQYDTAFTVIERNHTIFQQVKFANRHLFVPAPEPVEPVATTGTGTGFPAGKVSYQSAYNAIANRGSSYRFNLTKTLIPQIHNLTLDQLNNLANLNYSQNESAIVQFGMAYVVR